MKIVFIITDLAVGGSQVMLHKLVERLDGRFVPHVVSLTTVGAIGRRMAEQGIQVEALGMTPGVPNLLALRSLAGRLRQLAPAVVHTWMYHADLVGGVAARMAGISRVVWGIRNSDLDPKQTKLSTRLTVRACAALSGWLPDSILCCSEAAQQIHEKIGYAAAKMAVIPNGFDLGRFKPDAETRAALRSELQIPVEAPLVGMLARRDPQKNHEGLFAALRNMPAPLPHVVLAGEGVDPGDRRLLAAAKAAGVAEQTLLLGRRDDVPQLMAALDVLVCCSTYGEAFPNVIGEAMASGVPCVATDVGDSAQIVADTGRVVPRDDSAALQRALGTLLQMPARERAALGLQARARIEAHYEIGAVVGRYEAFYDALGPAARDGR